VSSSEVVFVTGALRGIGRAVALEFARRGHKVYGGGRSRPEDFDELPFTGLALDVTDEESVGAAVKRIMDECDRIDVLVNNAGLSHCGPLEETPFDYVREVFETNYFGLLRCVNAVLPAMRNQGSGTIANIGSAAGKIGIPFQGHYSASKFALEGLSESLRYELLEFGIRVLLIEPGDVATDIWERTKTPVAESSPYSRSMGRFLTVKEKEMSGQATPPEEVAKDIANIILSKTTVFRRPVAKMAGMLLFLRKILPDSVFLWAVARNYGIKQLSFLQKE